MSQLIVTRPRPQAAAWIARLAAAGVAAQSLPLIDIAAGEPGAAAAAWAQLPQAALTVFVSANAVAGFFAGRPADALWPAHLLAACVGPGSAQALLQVGVPTGQIVQPPADAASFDSEHLWPLLAHQAWQGKRVLLLRGNGGRDWLAERLREQGAVTQAFAVYQRVAPQLDAAGRALLAATQAQPLDHVWLLSSSESLIYLADLWPAGVSMGVQRAIATHARIASAAAQAGFGHVVLARPDATAVAQAFMSLG